MPDNTQPLDELESLLANQLELAAGGDIDGMLPLCEEATELARQIGPLTGFERGGQSPQVERIRRLHRQLSLTIAANKQEVAGRLKRMRNGKEAMRAYRPRHVP